jgi:hypothetical protein
MERLREMLADQHRLLNDLSAELQRREVTPERVVRLVKIVGGNVRILEHMATILERTINKPPESTLSGDGVN